VPRVTVNPGSPDRPLLRPPEHFGLRRLRWTDWVILGLSAAVGLGVFIGVLWAVGAL
jgi:hypothetical protein